jgi:hypothetical protein
VAEAEDVTLCMIGPEVADSENDASFMENVTNNRELRTDYLKKRAVIIHSAE